MSVRARRPSASSATDASVKRHDIFTLTSPRPPKSPRAAATKKLDPHTHSLLPRVSDTPNQQRANILLDRSRHLSHVDTCMLPVAINVAPASVLSVRPATSTGSVFTTTLSPRHGSPPRQRLERPPSSRAGGWQHRYFGASQGYRQNESLVEAAREREVRRMDRVYAPTSTYTPRGVTLSADGTKFVVREPGDALEQLGTRQQAASGRLLVAMRASGLGEGLVL